MKLPFALILLGVLTFFVSSCAVSVVSVNARLDLLTATTNVMTQWTYLPYIPDQTPTIISYVVPIRKIEVGLDANNTVTLWENDAIKSKNVLGGSTFENVNRATNGTYNFLQATYDSALICQITYTNLYGSNMSSVFTNNLMGGVQVFGISGSPGSVRQVLSSKIKIYDGALFTFLYAASNSVIIKNSYIYSALPIVSISNL